MISAKVENGEIKATVYNVIFFNRGGNCSRYSVSR